MRESRCAAATAFVMLLICVCDVVHRGGSQWIAGWRKVRTGRSCIACGPEKRSHGFIGWAICKTRRKWVKKHSKWTRLKLKKSLPWSETCQFFIMKQLPMPSTWGNAMQDLTGSGTVAWHWWHDHISSLGWHWCSRKILSMSLRLVQQKIHWRVLWNLGIGSCLTTMFFFIWRRLY